MTLTQTFACSTFLLVISFFVGFCHSSQPQFVDIDERQLVPRSNTSFYGAVALWVTITDQVDSCPSSLQTCTTGDDPTCCPEGTYCEDSGYYCCPIGIDCSPAVKLAPVCADPSWSLYEADGNGDILFCCLPGSHGLPGSGCVQDGSAGTATASSVAQATKTATSTSQGSTATSGSGNGTSTTPASSNPTKSGANKICAGTLMVMLAAVFVYGLSA